MSTSVPQIRVATPTAPPIPQRRDNPAVARFSLTGKVAIVTGGAGGLGFEAARALLEHDVSGLALFDISNDVGPQAVDQLKSAFPKANVIFKLVNVTDAALVTTAVNVVVEELGSVDILLTFAGIVGCVHAEDMTVEQWNRILEVNLTGSFLCAQAVGKYEVCPACAKEMIEQGTGGSIVLIASISGHTTNFPQPQVSYNVSKAGVLMTAKSLAAEWGRYGIRVNTISPGYMDTVLNEGKGLDEHKAHWYSRTPLGRMGGKDELNGTVILLCSEAGSFITGTDIKVDGGITTF
ncbi:NAD(P)-binding protein [Choiromyces venosus 120613-1]|uniref:D-arabinitol 2-dehydrogenase [ribulose-forming] n=1 Tax=Choiromyces venosus 120613-1 TaxID=1336337 RepID=A0A3N4JBK4_9PEZI|nr:NAD(P)-binding protein [Choiromyces venosus 120613-1]